MSKDLSQDWINWILENVLKGCDKNELLEILLKEGFDSTQCRIALGLELKIDDINEKGIIKKKPNYNIKSIRACEKQLAKEKLPQRIMIDCSHGNTNKDYTLQPKVAQYCIDQVIKGNESIIGIMLESNIHEGNQKITNDLKYGVSLTDACINWETTEKLLFKLAKRLRAK